MSDGRKRHRAWCFTLNNWTEQHQDRLRALVQSCDGVDEGRVHVTHPVGGCARYIRWGREVAPTTGTEHLQGLVSFLHGVSFAVCRRLLGGSAHVEPVADWDASMEYVIKDGDWEEHGRRPRPGARTDLERIASALVTGETTLHDVALEFPSRYLQYSRGWRALAAEVASQQPGQRQRPDILYLWGPSGVGKTRRANSDYPSPGAYWLPHPNCGTVWWDGYRGQDTVVIDEFNGWLTLTECLRILDRYPHSVRTHDGYVPLRAHRFVFTSNLAPDQIWPRLKAEEPDRWAGWLRRLGEYGTVERLEGVALTLPTSASAAGFWHP